MQNSATNRGHDPISPAQRPVAAPYHRSPSITDYSRPLQRDHSANDQHPLLSSDANATSANDAAGSKLAKDRSNSLIAHKLGHQLATHKLHAMVQQTPTTHRLENISKGNTVHGMTLALHKRHDWSTQKSKMDSASSVDELWIPPGGDSWANTGGDNTAHAMPSEALDQGNAADARQCEESDGFVYCLTNFWRVVDVESAPCDPPADTTQVTGCECGQPCDYRIVIDGQQIICVCASRQCTFLLQVGGPELDVADENESAAVRVPDSAPTQQEITETIDAMQSPEDWWNFAHTMMAFPDAEVARFFLSAVKDRPAVCFCGEPVGVGICRATEDIYWICPTRQCCFLERSNYLPQLGDMDIGQVLPHGQS